MEEGLTYLGVGTVNCTAPHWQRASMLVPDLDLFYSREEPAAGSLLCLLLFVVLFAASSCARSGVANLLFTEGIVSG